MIAVLVLSTTTFFPPLALKDEPTEDTDEEEELEEEAKEDNDTSEADEREEESESASEPASESESVSENETTWTLWVAEGTYTVSCIKEGGKIVFVGVGGTT